LRRALLTLTILLPTAVFSKQVTLRIPIEPEVYIVVASFDDDRVSVKDVKLWMQLHENAYYATPIDGYYPTECQRADMPKIEAAINKTKQIVKDLDANKYPPELAEVVGYLKDLQSFWLWQEQQELEFLKSGKLPDSKYKGLDLGMCEVRNSEDKLQACQEVSHDWHNCTLNRMMKQLGSYPKEKWKAFLDAFGIQEKIESTVD
jgi:hypothetical protein